MNRLWAAGIIAAALTILCWFGYRETSNIASEMQNSLLQVKSCVQSGDTETALELAQETISDWQLYYGTISTFIQHSRLEDIDQTLAVLPPLIAYGTNDQFEAECDRASAQIGRLRDTEFPSLENIL